VQSRTFNGPLYLTADDANFAAAAVAASSSSTAASASADVNIVS